jgi:hypothetical protein
MTEEQMRDLVKECGLDWQRGYMPLFNGDPTNRYAVLIEAVLDAEAEACAEACRSEQLMTVCDATDAAYMRAIDDCVNAIRARIAARKGGNDGR